MEPVRKDWRKRLNVMTNGLIIGDRRKHNPPWGGNVFYFAYWRYLCAAF